MKFSNEARVGALLLATLVVAVSFAWLIGIPNPLQKSVSFYVTYNYAGGIEIGSPVRVSGIKVGKVDKIEFYAVPAPKAAESIGANGGGEAIAPLRLRVAVDRHAAVGIRQDSQFYINMAGIIGERYIEITPGHLSSKQIESGDTVAGIDPPRFDQLISQSFDLAGKLKQILDENKGDFSRTIEILAKLSGNLNKTLAWVDQSGLTKDTGKLVENLIEITKSVRIVTDKAATPDGERTLRLLYQLLWRLEPLDREAIKKFFQQEGVKAHIF